MNKLRCLALLVGGFMAGADTQAQTINAFIPTNDELQGMNFYATEGAELFDDGTYPHTPFLETAITEQDAVVEANQKAGDGAGGASRQFHRLTATGEYTNTIGQALAVMLMRPSAATGGSIMKTAEHGSRDGTGLAVAAGARAGRGSTYLHRKHNSLQPCPNDYQTRLVAHHERIRVDSGIRLPCEGREPGPGLDVEVRPGRCGRRHH